jgi:hypothetical protein
MAQIRSNVMQLDEEIEHGNHASDDGAKIGDKAAGHDIKTKDHVSLPTTLPALCSHAPSSSAPPASGMPAPADSHESGVGRRATSSPSAVPWPRANRCVTSMHLVKATRLGV